MKTLKLNKILQNDLSYNEEGKSLFHKEAKKVLKELAVVLELPEYKVRSNIGGIAVSGEVILHSNSIYVLISQFSLKPNVLVRSCKSITDYVGGSNNYFSVIDLFNDDTLSKIKNISKNFNK